MSTPKIRFKGFTDDWEQWKLKELVEDLSTGKSVNSTDELVGENDIGVLKTSCVSYDFFDANECKKVVTEEIGYVKCPVEKNCIIVSRMNTPERVGACGFVDKDYPNLYLPDRLWKLKFLDKYDVRMIHCMLISPYYKADILSLASGTSGSMYNISKEDFENIELKVPSKDEQLVISKLFNNLDSLITLHQRKCDELQKVKKYMLQKMFPKKGEKVPEIRLAGFTGDWEQRKFGDVGSVSMCKRIFKDETTDEGDIPFFKIGTFGGVPDAYISRNLFEDYKAKYPYPTKGDILLSASGTIGRMVEYNGEEAYFQDSNIVWLSHDQSIDNRFLKVLYGIVKWDGIEGSTIQRLYNDNFLKTKFQMPSKEEQEKIGGYFANLDNLIALHQRKHETLKEIKKYMLQNMFPKK